MKSSDNEKNGADGSPDKKTLGQILSESAKEVGGTFVNLIKAPRALWGINISYLFEGLAYFGVLTILGKYLSEDIGMSDFHAGWVYSIFTGGITFAMLVLGGVSDKIGVRKALLTALGLMVVGRSILGLSGTLFQHGQGAGSPMFFTVLAGLAVVVIGYGMYQPAAYAGVKAFTNKKTAAIGFAMIYALMNLGAFFSGIISPPVRQATSMTGVFWVFVAITILAFLSVMFILTRRVVQKAEQKVKEDNQRFDQEEGADKEQTDQEDEDPAGEPAPGKVEAPKKPLLEPMAIALFMLVLGGLGGFMYQTIKAPSHPLQGAVTRYTEATGDAWSALATPGVKATPPGAGEAPEDTLISTLDAQLASASESSAVDPAGVEAPVFEIVKERVKQDRLLLTQLAQDPRRTAMPELSRESTQKARDILRLHSVTLMASAYGLSSETVMNADVVDGLRIRMKEINEEEIPMTPAQVQRITAIASQEPGAMLAKLGAEVQARIQEINALLGPEHAQSLTAGMSAEKACFLNLSNKLGQKPGPVSRELLQKILISDSTAAQSQARLLIAAVRESNFMERFSRALTDLLVTRIKPEKKTPPSFASVKVKQVRAIYGELGEALPRAVPLQTKEKAQRWLKGYGVFIIPAFLCLIFLTRRLLSLRPDHPFHDSRFTFFIFILIPVQTLFAHNWLTLPYYINRVFAGTALGDNFEFFSNLNPILIFFLTPLIAALTTRSDAYKMMIWGTLVMATPTFLLALPPSATMLLVYIVLMTIGEAMWQPRFLQLIAEIAPEGKTGAYMGIGQLPWFMTKLITGMYSGYFIANYVPKVGPQNSQFMWLIYALIAMISPVALIMARRWMGAYLQKRHS